MSTAIFQHAADEALQALMKREFTGAFQRAVSSGQGGTSAVSQALNAVARNSRVTSAVRSAAGSHGLRYGAPLMGYFLSGWLEHSGVIDTLIPKGTKGIVAQTARSILRTLPSVAIAAGNTVPDVIDDMMSGVQDDPALPKAERQGMLDNGIFMTYEPAAIQGNPYFARRDEDGDIIWLDETAGIPDVRNNQGMWRAAYAAWNQTGRGSTKTVGPKNAKRTVTQNGRQFCFDIDTEEAFQILGQPGANEQSTEALKALFRKPNWARDISDDTVLVLNALSRASLQFGQFDQILSEDLFKDLPDKVSATLINRMLGDKFAPLVIGGLRPTLSRDDYLAAKAVVDQWLGGELTPWNKVARAAGDVYNKLRHDRGIDPVSAGLAAGVIGLVVTAPLWGAALATFVFALIFTALFIWGFTLNVTGNPMVAFPVFGVPFPAVLASMIAMYLGSIGWFAITWFFPAWQGLGNSLTWFVKDRNPDWLRSIGRKIATFALTFATLQCFLVFFETPLEYRYLSLAPVIAMLGIALGLAEAGRSELAKLIATRNLIRMMYFFGSLPLVLILIAGPLAGHLGTTITGAVIVAWIVTSVVSWFASHWLLSIAGVLLLAAVGLWKLSLIERKHDRREKGADGEVYVDRFRSPWYIKALVFAALAALIGYLAIPAFSSTSSGSAAATTPAATAPANPASSAPATTSGHTHEGVDVCGSNATAYTKRLASCPGY